MASTSLFGSERLASPADQRVTFVELFFDLVFVFSVTQVVGLFHDGIEPRAVGQAVLVFWMVWWAWTQFTWTLNAADTTHTVVELQTLVATAIAFFMGVALPHAFSGRAAWFAVPYVLVRSIGLLMYSRVAKANPGQHAAVRRFSLQSIAGMVAVLIGGFTSGTALYALWGLAILLDIMAAAIGAQDEHWDLHGEHFAERHGLFIIIALGETLIVAASGMAEAEWNRTLIVVATLAVVLTCAFWWTYFTRAKLVLDHALESSRGARLALMARDAFSLLHFPMLCGIIAYAATLEQALAHPSDPFALPARLALALALLLFVGGMALSIWRCTRQTRWPRILIMTVSALVVVALSGVPPAVTLAIAFVGVTAVAIIEQRPAPEAAQSQGPRPMSAAG